MRCLVTMRQRSLGTEPLKRSGHRSEDQIRKLLHVHKAVSDNDITKL